MDAKTWVALSAAAIALLVGLLSPFISARATRRTIEAQRQMAQDQRLWEKRSETYEQLLTWAGDVRTDIVAAMESVASPSAWEDAKSRGKSHELPSQHNLFELSKQDPVEIPRHVEVGLAAYSSSRVNDAAQHFRDTLGALVQHFRDTVKATAPVIVENADNLSITDSEVLERLLAWHIEVADTMAQMISDEMHDVAPPDDGRPH